MKKSSPIPEALPIITPHLIVKGAAAAIAFYANALGTTDLYRTVGPDGTRIFRSVRTPLGIGEP